MDFVIFHYKSTPKYFFAVIFSLLLSACASTESKLAVPYVVELRAANNVNQSMGSRASPVKVTVFELKSSAAFERSDFFALQNNPQQALGDQLLDINSLILRPNGVDTIKGSGNIQAKVLGIIAAYRDINNSQWRLVLDLPEAKTTNFYKFWQFSPDEVRIVIDVNQASILVNQQQGREE